MDCYSVFKEYVEMAPFGGLKPALGQFDGKTILVLQRMDEVLREEWARAQWLLRLAEHSRFPLLLCGFSAETDVFLGELLTLQVPVFALGGNIPVVDEVFAEMEGFGKELKEKLTLYLGMSLDDLLSRRRRRFEAFGRQPPAGVFCVDIRPATPEDVPRIPAFLQPFVDKRQILARSEEEISQNLEYFLLAVGSKDGALLGTVALRDFDGGLFEIRSLTVAHEYEGHGIGTRLVKASVELAKKHEATRIFTLTMRKGLFHRCGFSEVCIMRFPGKVQVDCLNCSKKEHCDESAMLLELGQTRS